MDTFLESFSEKIYVFLKTRMCFFSVFSMLGLFVFLVLFTAGGNLKTQLKQCRVVQNQGFQQMKENMFRVRFGVDLGMSCSVIFGKNVT